MVIECETQVDMRLNVLLQCTAESKREVHINFPLLNNRHLLSLNLSENEVYPYEDEVTSDIISCTTIMMKGVDGG